MAVTRNGVAADLLEAGAIMKTAFCGPCFGAGDVPANDAFSIRHTTRNFPNREGSKPGQGQISSVALMDARSIAATAKNGGVLTSAADIDYTVPEMPYHYDGEIYQKRCYYGFGKADPDAELRFGPNIADWPKMHPLQENLLVKLAAVIDDPVTTTDELIPSGETSSYRSNPIKLSEFALSRRVPEYVGRSKAARDLAGAVREGVIPDELTAVMEALALPSCRRSACFACGYQQEITSCHSSGWTEFSYKNCSSRPHSSSGAGTHVRAVSAGSSGAFVRLTVSQQPCPSVSREQARVYAS